MPSKQPIMDTLSSHSYRSDQVFLKRNPQFGAKPNTLKSSWCSKYRCCAAGAVVVLLVAAAVAVVLALVLVPDKSMPEKAEKFQQTEGETQAIIELRLRDTFQQHMDNLAAPESVAFNEDFCRKMDKTTNRIYDQIYCSVLALRSGSIYVIFQLRIQAGMQITSESLHRILTSSSPNRGPFLMFDTMAVYKGSIRILCLGNFERPCTYDGSRKTQTPLELIKPTTLVFQRPGDVGKLTTRLLGQGNPVENGATEKQNSPRLNSHTSKVNNWIGTKPTTQGESVSSPIPRSVRMPGTTAKTQEKPTAASGSITSFVPKLESTRQSKAASTMTRNKSALRSTTKLRTSTIPTYLSRLKSTALVGTSPISRNTIDVKSSSTSRPTQTPGALTQRSGSPPRSLTNKGWYMPGSTIKPPIISHNPIKSTSSWGNIDAEFSPFTHGLRSTSKTRSSVLPSLPATPPSQLLSSLSHILRTMSTSKPACNLQQKCGPPLLAQQALYNCPSNGTLFIPSKATFPHDCEAFIYCSAGQAIPWNCPEGTAVTYIMQNTRNPCDYVIHECNFCKRMQIFKEAGCG